MIPSRLEDLVLRGFAVVRNYSGGYSALYTIPCPNGSFIIITHISVLPGQQTSATLSDLVLTVANQIGGDEVFIFRAEGYNSGGGQFNGYFCHLDTYIVGNQDIRLRFTELRPGAFGTTYAPAGEVTKEPPPPVGYFGINFVSQVDTANGRNYKPIGQKYSLILGPGAIDQPSPGPDAGISDMPDSPAPWEGLILNFQYVIVNRAWADFIGGK